MRVPIEALARKIAKEPTQLVTVAELAEKHREPPERIVDAMCVLKLLVALDVLEEAPITYVDVR